MECYEKSCLKLWEINFQVFFYVKVPQDDYKMNGWEEKFGRGGGLRNLIRFIGVPVFSNLLTDRVSMVVKEGL